MIMKNSKSSYGVVTKVLHWFSAIFVLSAMLIGIWFTWVDLDTDYGWEQFELYINWHVGFGFTVLIAMLPRLFWRLNNVTPNLSEDVPPAQAKLAQSIHGLLYIVAILTPLTGWLGSSLEGHSLHYFSILEIRPFLGTHMELATFMEGAHFYFSWSFIALLLLHLFAVLYHHFWLKHSILQRML